MAKKGESLFIVLAQKPWWWSLIAAAIVYILLRFLFPMFAESGLVTNFLVKDMAVPSQLIAPYFAALFLIPILFSLLLARKRRSQ